MNATQTLLPGSTNLWQRALETTAARGHRLSKWRKEDKAALKLALDYIRRSYKAPGAAFPRLVPYGRELTCGQHHIAQFSSFEIASAAEAIARQSAERCGLPV